MKFWPSRCGEVEEIRLVVSSGHPTSKARAFTIWRLMMMMMMVVRRRKKKKMLMLRIIPLEENVKIAACHRCCHYNDDYNDDDNDGEYDDDDDDDVKIVLQVSAACHHCCH